MATKPTPTITATPALLANVRHKSLRDTPAPAGGDGVRIAVTRYTTGIAPLRQRLDARYPAAAPSARLLAAWRHMDATWPVFARTYCDEQTTHAPHVWPLCAFDDQGKSVWQTIRHDGTPVAWLQACARLNMTLNTAVTLLCWERLDDPAHPHTFCHRTLLADLVRGVAVDTIVRDAQVAWDAAVEEGGR